MAEEIVFYTNPKSRARTVRWMLEEVGQPYRAEVLDFGPPMKTAQYRAVNPMGKVPAIRHGATVVTEVAAICAYLADAFPEAGLAPTASDPARGLYYRWLFFSAGPVEYALIDKALGVSVPSERRGMVGYGCYEDMVETLDQLLSGTDYVAGNRFTAADLCLGALLNWTMAFGIMDKRPSFERYVSRLTERPAYGRATAIDEALIAEATQPPSVA
ncbi:glutathione S-transferase family protein [Aurantimonas sp. MSK8Z-1]|uniref:glutathione S-transferase family protein n=1 Tax=Mangrovibrevibacter kandeliae TaxID=2968473 RepID=UPI00211774CE|nr:glutathione S-transferase family protein [Aurantimonas sp. MSK8Z-1]MCW4113763.1 glutathione S-transferase family protein [Aurantimonas sp. MSK8Z-1]